METCKFVRTYTTCDKVGVKCNHPSYETPKHITCDLVCQVCELDKNAVVNEPEE